MSDLAKLEAMYEKEARLYRSHKEKADRLKEKIDEEKGQAITRSVRNIKLSPEEFLVLQKALADEKNVRELVALQLERQEAGKRKTPGETSDGGEVTDGTGNGQGTPAEGE